MISRALRGKCPLSFYNQGKGATRKSPRGRAAIRAAPPCCPCLVPCAFAPITTTQRQSLEKLGIGGQAQCPLLTSRARAAQITLHA